MPTPEQQFARFRDRADGSARAAVFDELAPELLLIAAHVAPAGAEPEDLVQATFVDAIEKAPRWDRDRLLMPWLIGCAMALSMNWYALTTIQSVRTEGRMTTSPRTNHRLKSALNVRSAVSLMDGSRACFSV